MGSKVAFTRVRGLFITRACVALLLALASVVPARAQTIPPERMQAMIVSFNDWVSTMKDPLTGDKPTDGARVTKARQAAASGPWLDPFPNERASITARLDSINQFLGYLQPGQPYQIQIRVLCQEIADYVKTVRNKLVELNGGKEVLYASNSSGVAPVGTQPPTTTTGAGTTGAGTTGAGTGTPTGTGTGTPVDGRATPGGGPGSLLGVGSQGGTTGPSLNPGGQSTGTPTTTSAGSTPSTTPAAPTTIGTPNGPQPTGSTNGAVNRGGAKSQTALATQLLHSLLDDGNLANGAVVGVTTNGGGISLSTTQAARDSLGDIAAVLNKAPLTTSYGGDVSAIVSQMQAIANGNFGSFQQAQMNQAFQMANGQVRAARDQIFQKLTALNAKIDAGQ